AKSTPGSGLAHGLEMPVYADEADLRRLLLQPTKVSQGGVRNRLRTTLAVFVNADWGFIPVSELSGLPSSRRGLRRDAGVARSDRSVPWRGALARARPDSAPPPPGHAVPPPFRAASRTAGTPPRRSGTCGSRHPRAVAP